MYKLTNELIRICRLASCIASDDFETFENLLKELKSKKNTAPKIYELILQSYLFCGFPATIESMKIFRKYFPHFKKLKSKYEVSDFKKSGEVNCKLIYKKNYKKLIENMNYISPELKEWMIIEGYGKVLNRNGLSLPEREFINVALLCTRYYENQLHSHIKGCLNLGARKSDLIKIFDNIKDISGKENTAKTLKLLNCIQANQD